MKTLLITIALVPVGLYLATCILLFFGQRWLIYPAPGAKTPLVGQSMYVEVPGGTPLLYRAASPDGPVVVHFHGNGEDIGAQAWLAEEVARAGASFVAVEYPGYAGTPGAPSEASIMAAAEQALSHLKGPMGIAADRIVLSGQSLGSGVAVALASRGHGKKLALISPYTSLADVGARSFSYVPVRRLMRDRFDSLARASSIEIPVLVLHGTHDDVIPFDLGQALAAAFPRARLIALAGTRHNDVWLSDDALRAYVEFVGR